MPRIAAAFLLLVAVSLAAPAGAQIAGKRVPERVTRADPLAGDSRLPAPAIRRDLRSARQRIDRARDAGALTRREARQLEREAGLIASLARRYGRDGLSASEKRELETRTLYLRDAVNRRPANGGDRR